MHTSLGVARDSYVKIPNERLKYKVHPQAMYIHNV